MNSNADPQQEAVRGVSGDRVFLQVLHPVCCVTVMYWPRATRYFWTVTFHEHNHRKIF